ncbi:MAG: DUF4256 domain-containing protein [Bacteroidota bacterium]|nr:DUF4256 domain-containing protein [Bacteroidota bacterium]
MQIKCTGRGTKWKASDRCQGNHQRPDVIGLDADTEEYIFCDCSTESPTGRRNVCYDRQGLESSKEHRPKSTALDMAPAMGIELLTESQYLDLQKLG